MMKSLKFLQLVKNKSFTSTLNFQSISSKLFCSKIENTDSQNKKQDSLDYDKIELHKIQKEKNDPHTFQIYRSIKPTVGKAPEEDPIPPFANSVKPPLLGQRYNKVDEINSYKFALENNYEIKRDSVLSFYRIHMKDKTYHVFNGARYVSKYIINFIN